MLSKTSLVKGITQVKLMQPKKERMPETSFNIRFIPKRFDQFEDDDGKIVTDVVISASELVRLLGGATDYTTWNIPLEANVRRPSENIIVRSILRSLSENKTSYTFHSPIFILCSAIWKEEDNVCVSLTNHSERNDGVLDGGHRLYALKLAESRDINLNNVFLSLKFFTNFSSEERSKTAIALNTSAQVRNTSISNYNGIYNPIKQVLVGYKIAYFENDPKAPKDCYCNVNRVLALVKCLDTSFGKNNETKARGSKRHPICAIATVSRPDRVSPLLEKYGHLLKDAVDIQSEIAEEINKRFKDDKKKLLYVAESKKCNTELPTEHILDCKLPATIYIFPILSSLKVFLDDNNQWYPGFKKHRTRVLSRLITKMTNILDQAKYNTVKELHNARNEKIWDVIWDEAEKIKKELYEE